jgi:hypothetical protein
MQSIHHLVFGIFLKVSKDKRITITENKILRLIISIYNEAKKQSNDQKWWPEYIQMLYRYTDLYFLLTEF